jgi:hypothetical protein
LATISLIAGPAFAQATNVAGDRDVTIVSPQGPNTTRLAHAGRRQAEGDVKSPMGELAVAGSVTGSDVKIAFTIDLQGQSLDITLNGKANRVTIAVPPSSVSRRGRVHGEARGYRRSDDDGAATTTAAARHPASTSISAAGKWDVTFKTPQGDMPGTATFAVEGDKVTGTFGSQMGEAPLTGTLSGKSLKLKLQAQTPQGEMQVDMTGDLDGDSIVNGKAEVMGMQLDWVAKRVKQ